MDSISTDPVPELPNLDPEVTLLTADGQASGALQSLVLDHLLLTEGQALWIDAKNNAATTSLAKIAPSRRILDRIQVARAFTAFQHYSLIDDLEEAITDDTSLIVTPSIEWFYTNEDLYSGEGEEMLECALEILEVLCAKYEIPILVSRDGSADSEELVERYCDSELTYIPTEFGPRFSGEEYETLVFKCEGGVQTTFAFWRRILETRHSAQLAQEPQEVTHVGSY